MGMQMLNPFDDRLDYGKIIKPDEGFVLDFAVGTTYSLDLNALIGVLMPLGLSEETDSSLMCNPVYILEALRRTADKVAIFCEGGQIHTPNKMTQLYILLEKIVFTVKTRQRKAKTAYPSFHPKVWLIRYTNGDQIKYRIVVLSRNLTFDRSWDISFYMDGEVQDKKSNVKKNQPVCDFLKYLIGQLPRENENSISKKKKIKKIIDELANVTFQLDDKQFNDYEFIPVGISNSNDNLYDTKITPLFDKDYAFNEILVMSPFISLDMLEEFNNRNENCRSRIRERKYMLFTRKMSLDKLKDSAGNSRVPEFEIYTLKDEVIDGELMDQVVEAEHNKNSNNRTNEEQNDVPEESAVLKHDIHAKLFMLLRGNCVHLYLGSLNASHNAINGNVEFMVCLKSTKSYLNIDTLSKSLFCGEYDNKNNPFKKVDLARIEEINEPDDSSDINQIIKAINRSSPKAKVFKCGNLYNVEIDFSNFDMKYLEDKSGFKIFIRLLLAKNSQNYAEKIYFQEIPIIKLSEFYVISVQGKQTVERVLKITTEGMPAERENELVTNIVSSKNNFYQYISYLLGEDLLFSVMETNRATRKIGNTANSYIDSMPNLYEKMLKTAASDPDRFKGIDYLLTTISKDGIIPENFKMLHDTFKKVMKE